MTVKYHERLHNTIWNEIRNVCDNSHYSPADVLNQLLVIIDIVQQSYNRDNSEWIHETQLGDDGSERHHILSKILSEANHLITENLQDPMSWHTLKTIIQFYLDDSVYYIDSINALRQTCAWQNEYFELGIDFDQERETMTYDKFRNILIYSRYLTGTRIYDWCEERNDYETTLLARGEQDYWSERVIAQALMDEPSQPINQTKVKLSELYAFIEEKKDKWNMEDGDYIKISDIFKEVYDTI